MDHHQDQPDQSGQEDSWRVDQDGDVAMESPTEVSAGTVWDGGAAARALTLQQDGEVSSSDEVSRDQES